MHKLLERQVKRYFGRDVSINDLDEKVLNLLKDVSQTYCDNELERKFLDQKYYYCKYRRIEYTFKRKIIFIRN